MSAPDSSRTELYTLYFEERPEYLYALLKGEKDTYEIAQQYGKEAAQKCRRLKCKKLLVEEDIKGEMSETEMYWFMSEISEIGFSGIRIAFVDRHHDQQELNKFGELVATNRGVRGKIFDTIEEAEKWLLS